VGRGDGKLHALAGAMLWMPARKLLISTTRSVWRGGALLAHLLGRARCRSRRAFSSGFVTGWPASRESAIPSLHRIDRPDVAVRVDQQIQ
jgi:hypothetical protein